MEGKGGGCHRREHQKKRVGAKIASLAYKAYRGGAPPLIVRTSTVNQATTQSIRTYPASISIPLDLAHPGRPGLPGSTPVG